MQGSLKLFIGAAVAATCVTANDNGLGRVPPMGWRSWNCFHGSVNQTLIERQVDALVAINTNASRGVVGKSLKDVGFVSIGLDDNWQACGKGVNGSFHSADGTPLINTETFPNMSGMVAYGHSKDVRMGFYINNCICKETMLAPDFATKVYSSTTKLMAAQNWDGVKIDSCSQFHRLDVWAEEIAAQGKPMMIENCHNNESYPVRDKTTGKVQCPENFFRVSSDINADWEKVTQNLQCSIYWNKLINPIAGPGCFAYPDMLEVGDGTLSFAQSRSHFGAWVMMSAPLILGLDMANELKMDAVWDIITNEETLNISQTYHLHPGFLVTSNQLGDRAVSHATPMPAAASPAAVDITASPPPVKPAGYLWAIAPNASDPGQLGWSHTSTGLLRHGSFCLETTPTNGFAFADCTANDPAQEWAFEANGNLHRSNTKPCVASRDWVGPAVVLAPCSTGVNEEWHLDASTGTLCSGGSATSPHPQRCLAFNVKPPPGSNPGPRKPWTIPASWQVYAKPQEDNKYALFLFNIDNVTNDVSIDITALGYTGAVSVRDVWAHQDWPAGANQHGSIITITGMGMHDSALLMVTPAASNRADKVGTSPHPFTKISPEWVAKINQTQYESYTAGQACSYHKVDWSY